MKYLKNSIGIISPVSFSKSSQRYQQIFTKIFNLAKGIQLTNQSVTIIQPKKGKNCSKLEFKLLSFNKPKRKGLLGEIEFSLKLINQIKKARLNIIYCRYNINGILLFFLLKIMNIRIIFEFNSILNIELKKEKRFVASAVLKILEPILILLGSQYVFVTKELQYYYVNRYKITKPRMIFPNGYVVPRNQPILLSVEYDLIVVSSNKLWHGIDLLESLVESCSFLQKYKIAVIGPKRCHPHIIYLGERYGIKLDNILRKSLIGVGSLALFRVGIHESSSLKIRNYLSLGLPVILGCKDSQLSEKQEFVLEIDLENHFDDAALKILRFINFVKINREQLSTKSYLFAKENMDYKYWGREIGKFIRSY